jgi:hypothetical protein
LLTHCCRLFSLSYTMPTPWNVPTSMSCCWAPGYCWSPAPLPVLAPRPLPCPPCACRLPGCPGPPDWCFATLVSGLLLVCAVECFNCQVTCDLHQECSKYGSVVDIKVPRPPPGTAAQLMGTEYYGKVR